MDKYSQHLFGCNVQYNSDIAQIGGAIYGFRSAKTGKEPDFALYT